LKSYLQEFISGFLHLFVSRICLFVCFLNYFAHHSKLFSEVFYEKLLPCAQKFTAIVSFKICSSEFPVDVLPFFSLSIPVCRHEPKGKSAEDHELAL